MRLAERLKQSDRGFLRGVGNFLTLEQLIASKLKTKLGKKNQDTQGKQEEQGSGGGGGGGSPPTPPDIKSDKKEEQAKINGMPIDEYIKKKQKA